MVWRCDTKHAYLYLCMLEEGKATSVTPIELPAHFEKAQEEDFWEQEEGYWRGERGNFCSSTRAKFQTRMLKRGNKCCLFLPISTPVLPLVHSPLKLDWLWGPHDSEWGGGLILRKLQRWNRGSYSFWSTFSASRWLFLITGGGCSLKEGRRWGGTAHQRQRT